MAEKRPRRKISAKKRRQNKRKKLMLSFIATLLAVAVLVGAIFLTSKLVSGDKAVLDNNINSEEVQNIESEETENTSVNENSQEILQNDETEQLTQDLDDDEVKETVNKPEPGEFGTLVNVENPLPADFTPDVREIEGTGKLFDVRAAEDLERLLNDASEAGYPMYLVSTYRTIEYQEGLYQRKVNEYINAGHDEESAKKEAAQWVAIPGTSEHNLGLAADIVSSTWYQTNSDLTQEFENTEHFTWLKENCADYGFMISFPKGKEDITGIVYEPWHYRYVGVELATYCMENNLCLEEYYEQ